MGRRTFGKERGKEAPTSITGMGFNNMLVREAQKLNRKETRTSFFFILMGGGTIRCIDRREGTVRACQQKRLSIHFYRSFHQKRYIFINNGPDEEII